MSSEKQHIIIIGHLNMQCTLSVLNPASSFLHDINDYKVTPGCRMPLSPAQSEDLVPEPEAGHGGGAAWDHEGDKHTLVVGGDTSVPELYCVRRLLVVATGKHGKHRYLHAECVVWCVCRIR